MATTAAFQPRRVWLPTPKLARIWFSLGSRYDSLCASLCPTEMKYPPFRQSALAVEATMPWRAGSESVRHSKEMFRFGVARRADTMGESVRGPSKKVKGVRSSWLNSTLRCPGTIAPPKVGSKYRACDNSQLKISVTSSPRLAYSRLVSEKVTWLVFESRSVSSKRMIFLKSCPIPVTYS